MSRRMLSFLLFVAVALTASACTSAAEEATEAAVTEEAVTQEPAATPSPAPSPTSQPTPLPTPEPTPEPVTVEIFEGPGSLEIPLPLAAAAPGTLIDSEEIDFAIGQGLRIAYHSTSVQGDAVAVTGFVAYPAGEAPAEGWPLIAWAHGTVGLGDSCAPSRNAETDRLAQALVGLGFAVVATDYEGLGTPGLHPYVVGSSEAYGVLDSVRAVQALALPVTDEWVAFGHSQGGHAAMFTGQLQPTYAPELNMVGVVAGAPPSQQSDLRESLVGGDFQGYLVMTAAGLAAGYDSLDIADVLSAEALELIDVVETGCTGDIFAVYNPLDYDAVVEADPFSLPAWNTVLAANDANQLPVQAPLLIIHGGEDEQIPVETSALLLSQLCAFPGQGPVVRNVYEGQSHAGVLTSFVAVGDIVSWVEARFAGEEAPTDCK